MTVLKAGQLTLLDYAKRLDPNGQIADVAELLSQDNEWMEDAVSMEANKTTSHMVAVRTGLPEVYWRAINKGVPRSKSTTAQIEEPTSMMEAFPCVDEALADLGGNKQKLLLSENKPFVEAMGQKQTQTMFYGNPAGNPMAFQGFAPRYSSLSAGNGQNIIDASVNSGTSATTNTSIWLVVWGEETVFNIFPKGSKAGLQYKYLGVETVADENGNEYRAHRTQYKWHNGLCVKDWRYVVRIANINTEVLRNVGAGYDSPMQLPSLPLVEFMDRAIVRVPNLRAGRAAFYANRNVVSALRVQALYHSSNALAIQPSLNQFGTHDNVLHFMGIPVRTVDQIINNEGKVS
ncbi:MAG: hypothetical protein LBI35_02615 [Burkholderiales bacterium]|jgi:hypothetical protein|nr:hypothetical protein [Burkholderiales bacterium]